MGAGKRIRGRNKILDRNETVKAKTRRQGRIITNDNKHLLNFSDREVAPPKPVDRPASPTEGKKLKRECFRRKLQAVNRNGEPFAYRDYVRCKKPLVPQDRYDLRASITAMVQTPETHWWWVREALVCNEALLDEYPFLQAAWNGIDGSTVEPEIIQQFEEFTLTDEYVELIATTVEAGMTPQAIRKGIKYIGTYSYRGYMIEKGLHGGRPGTSQPFNRAGVRVGRSPESDPMFCVRNGSRKKSLRKDVLVEEWAKYITSTKKRKPESVE